MVKSNDTHAKMHTYTDIVTYKMSLSRAFGWKKAKPLLVDITFYVHWNEKCHQINHIDVDRFRQIILAYQLILHTHIRCMNEKYRYSGMSEKFDFDHGHVPW